MFKFVTAVVGLFASLILFVCGDATPRVSGAEPGAQAKAGPFFEELLGTDWYGLYLQGKKIGYVRISRARDDNSGDIVYVSELKAKLSTQGQKVELQYEQELRFERQPPHRFLSAKQRLHDGASERTTAIVPLGANFKVASSIAGKRSQKVIDALDFTLADALAVELWVRTAPKVGSTLIHKDLDVETAILGKIKQTIANEKTSLVNGVVVDFFEVKAQQNQVELLARYDEKGKLLSGNFVIFEFRAEPEEQAKDTQYSQDLFVFGMVKVDRKLGDSNLVKSLVLEVTGEAGKLFAPGPRQSITEKAPKAYVVKLGKRYGVASRASAAEIKRNLEETLEYPISNPRIKALAKQAIADAASEEEKVMRLVAFVQRFIEPRLSATTPSIHDLLKRRSGDCKAYALLFNTLARAAGIPAREVSGLVYSGDDAIAFGGNAWNEVVLDGHWLPVDASMGEMDLSATHIAFSGPLANLHAAGGNLSFRVLEIELDLPLAYASFFESLIYLVDNANRLLPGAIDNESAERTGRALMRTAAKLKVVVARGNELGRPPDSLRQLLGSEYAKRVGDARDKSAEQANLLVQRLTRDEEISATTREVLSLSLKEYAAAVEESGRLIASWKLTIRD